MENEEPWNPKSLKTLEDIPKYLESELHINHFKPGSFDDQDMQFARTWEMLERSKESIKLLVKELIEIKKRLS